MANFYVVFKLRPEFRPGEILPEIAKLPGVHDSWGIDDAVHGDDITVYRVEGALLLNAVTKMRAYGNAKVYTEKGIDAVSRKLTKGSRQILPVGRR